MPPSFSHPPIVPRSESTSRPTIGDLPRSPHSLPLIMPRSPPFKPFCIHKFAWRGGISSKSLHFFTSLTQLSKFSNRKAMLDLHASNVAQSPHLHFSLLGRRKFICFHSILRYVLRRRYGLICGWARSKWELNLLMTCHQLSAWRWHPFISMISPLLASPIKWKMIDDGYHTGF